MKWQHANWTDARKQAVRELWAKGYSAGEIAGMLDIFVSRNAVIGIVHRRGYTQPAPVRKPPPPPPKPAALKPPLRPAPPEPPMPADFRHLPLELLQHWHCRWPSGDSDFTFCGQPKQYGSSYCSHHHRKAYSR